MIPISSILSPKGSSVPQGSFLALGSDGAIRPRISSARRPRPHHGIRVSFSARWPSCFAVPKRMTSLFLTPQVMTCACTAASPPRESISCLMMLAAGAGMSVT
ncbi:MAG: hypothetical protein LUE09_05970 [Synergistaceae bacterium]|nr:hypothetical protein [Synergistaceae bacterium]